MKFNCHHHEILRDVEASQPLLCEMDIVVCGGEASGKSSCVERFLFDRFLPTRRESEDERTYVKFVGLKSGGKVKLNILDTMIGNTVFGTQRYNWIEFADAFYLVYDLNNYRSFREVHYYISLIERVRGNLDVPICLVGSKLDAVSIWREQPCKNLIRPVLSAILSSIVKIDIFLIDVILTYIGEPPRSEVKRLTGLHLANKVQADYFETSSLQGINIMCSWAELIGKVVTESVREKNCIVC